MPPYAGVGPSPRPRPLAEILAEGQPPPRLLEGEGLEPAAAPEPRRPDLSLVPPRGAPAVTAEVGTERSTPESRDAGGGWFSRPTPLELAMQGAFLGLTATDWQQTRAFRKLGWQEANPLLGKQPSIRKVDALIPLGMAAHTLGAYALPRPYRNIAQVLGILGEAAAVAHNSKIPQVGWGWKF